MTCRSPARCRACEHGLATGACALEAQVDLALEPHRPIALVHARMRALSA